MAPKRCRSLELAFGPKANSIWHVPKHFRQTYSLSICLLVLLFSIVVTARYHNSIHISFLCLYKTAYLEWVQEGWETMQNKTKERAWRTNMKKKCEGQIWKKKKSFKLFHRQQNTPSQKCNYCFLLSAEQSIYSGHCMNQMRRQSMFAEETSGYFNWTSYEDVLGDLGVCWCVIFLD